MPWGEPDSWRAIASPLYQRGLDGVERPWMPEQVEITSTEIPVGKTAKIANTSRMKDLINLIRDEVTKTAADEQLLDYIDELEGLVDA